MRWSGTVPRRIRSWTRTSAPRFTAVHGAGAAVMIFVTVVVYRMLVRGNLRPD